MSRQPRAEIPGAYYHVTSRGNNKQNIFLDNADRVRFLEILGKVVAMTGWECYAFCLMNNHYHLVVRTPDFTLGRGMKYLNGVYTQWFNFKYRRVGHLLQGRFYSRLIKREAHLLALVRYVVQNPVKAGLCEHLSDWEWSSYGATSGLSSCPGFLSVDFFLGLFSDDKKSAQRAYIEYVKLPAAVEPWMRFENTGIYNEDSGNAISLNDLIHSHGDMQERNRSILNAYRNHSFNMREIADFLGISKARVCQIIAEADAMEPYPTTLDSAEPT